MTPGNNGASTPEDDDPFGYLYADGQANGAQPPSGGYGYPGSVNRVRTVGQRQYGQPGAQAPTAPYGQVPQQQTHGQAPYGQTNAHYAAPETVPGGASTTRQSPAGSGGSGPGRGRGPNTKGLLIGAIAVVAAVVIGIAVAMTGGNSDGNKNGAQSGSSASAAQSTSPSQSSSQQSADDSKLPTIDAKALRLEGGATTASDVKGAKADGGVYVTGFNAVGAAVTWSVDVPATGQYTLHTGYGVPGVDATATLTINGTAQTSPLKLKNWAQAPQGDWEKGWTKTYNYIQLNKGTNTIRVSCEQGNQCNANLDQLWLTKGWSN
ncbi:carbohydrate-binding protein [Streptomyces hygroscopicus]|uniref:CBM35 domain-containing protein n=1 Tax=Streptomyces hygroscopicus TaxID=1912 RepID=UPI0022404277|nr:CBM35 domain-containing protein [Streptomyces hygroscopicus]MCW7942338.1 carbohydrate-binding protein [Streptomyces hygroscopicus]